MRSIEPGPPGTFRHGAAAGGTVFPNAPDGAVGRLRKLPIDADPQCNASLYLLSDERFEARTRESGGDKAPRKDGNLYDIFHGDVAYLNVVTGEFHGPASEITGHEEVIKTFADKGSHEGIGAISLDTKRTEDLEAFLLGIGEIGILVLAMAHIGPYLLISQPVRRYMLASMLPPARSRFLLCMGRISVPWAKHQRSAALTILHNRKRRPVASRDGLLLDEDGLTLVVTPDAMAR